MFKIYQSNADGKISPPTASNTTSTPLPSVSFNTLLHKDSGLLISNEINAPLSRTIKVFFSSRQAPITLNIKLHYNCIIYYVLKQNLYLVCLTCSENTGVVECSFANTQCKGIKPMEIRIKLIQLQ